MFKKFIVFLFGKLTPEEKEDLLVILNNLVKSAAEGAVSGAKKG